MTDRLEGIPTNIISGFLGAGKSTAILNLLKAKPESERWAILVNEFGEVGIDGGLLTAGGDGNVFIREVPGGCMCCTAGLPMQMAMNMLLARAKPDRLIIEPTGLGHPFEVVNVLSTEHYKDVLDIRATVTLVDARKIADERYINHQTFNEQLEIADVIVASKSDLYADGDFERLEAYLNSKGWLQERTLTQSSGEGLSSPLLEQEAKTWRFKDATGEGAKVDSFPIEEPAMAFPPEGFVRLSNQGEGFISHGWIFEPSLIFDRKAVYQSLSQTKAERIKALVRTNEGSVGYNFAGDAPSELALESLEDSRIEVIATESFDVEKLEQELLKAAGKD